MHTLIVTSHPDTSSYTHAVVAKVIEGIGSSPGYTYEVADLMEEGFDPRFTKQDIADFRAGIRPTDERVLAEQARLDRADHLVLVFPVYWWTMPGLMKGWIDRVFTQQWAYIDNPDGGLTKLLTRLHVHVIGIGGATRRTYEKRGYGTAFHTEIDEGIFGFCGAPVLGSEILLPLDEDSAQQGLQRAFEIGQGLATR
ncbi:NAD(P)H-dependent oxidoreductase [Luteolibacter flavescens]